MMPIALSNTFMYSVHSSGVLRGMDIRLLPRQHMM